MTPAVLFCYWTDTVTPADSFSLLQAGWAVSINQNLMEDKPVPIALDKAVNVFREVVARHNLTTPSVLEALSNHVLFICSAVSV